MARATLATCHPLPSPESWHRADFDFLATPVSAVALHAPPGPVAWVDGAGGIDSLLNSAADLLLPADVGEHSSGLLRPAAVPSARTPTMACVAGGPWPPPASCELPPSPPLTFMEPEEQTSPFPSTTSTGTPAGLGHHASSTPMSPEVGPCLGCTRMPAQHAGAGPQAQAPRLHVQSELGSAVPPRSGSGAAQRLGLCAGRSGGMPTSWSACAWRWRSCA